MSNEKKESWATVILRNSGKFLEAITTGKAMQTRYRLIPTEHLNAATRAGLIDGVLGKLKNGKPVGAPIIRFDNPHKGSGVSKFPHINIDPNGRPNANHPHIKVPANLIACADKIDKCLKTVSKALLIVALVTDGIRICAAIYEDATSDDNHVLPHKTIETIASIAGGWVGGAAGASGGSLLGATIGACVGSLFGGVGAVIGAPIGAIVGGFVGGFAGGLLGSYLGEQGAKGALDFIEKGGFGPPTDWNHMFALTFAELQPTNLIQVIVENKDPEKVSQAKGALAGMAAGAALGTTVGPIGTVVGGAVGALYGAVNWGKLF